MTPNHRIWNAFLVGFGEIAGITMISVMIIYAKPVAGELPKFEVQGCPILILFWNGVKQALNQSLVQLVLQ